MRRWLTGVLCVAAGATAANLQAQDLQWRPAEAQPAQAPVVALDRPVAAPAAAGTSAASAVPALGRPVALNATVSSNVFDPRVTQTSYNQSLLAAPQVIVRGQIEELHQPMPLGPTTTDGTVPSTSSSNPPSSVLPPGAIVDGAGPVMNGTVVADGCGVGGCGDCCVPGCCCDGCCHDGSAFWITGEYLLWWVNNARVPALLTTSPPGTPTTTAGVLGLPTTTVLIGGDSLQQGSFSGGRLAAGYWFDDEHAWGVDGSVFFLGQRTKTLTDASFGTPILVRPFFNVGTGTEFGELVAFPGILAGSISVTSKTDLWGFDSNIRREAICWGNFRVDALVGFRYLNLVESLDIDESLLVTTPGTLAGSTIGVADHFGTRNTFYGGQIGADAEWRWRNWFVDGDFKFGIGDNHQTVDINGSTTFTLPTGTTTVERGGLLALPTNIGHYSRDKFAFLPELGAKVGYQFTPRIRAFVGYDCILLTDAVRPGDQINRNINTTQLPTSGGPGTLVGPAQPSFAFHQTDFWAQGIDFGIEFRY